MGRDEKNRDRIEEHKELVGTTQQKKVLESKAMNAEAIHDALILEGQEEIHRTWSALAWSGLASGLTMGISMLAEAALQAHLPDTNWRPLVSKIGYSFGFAVVTLGRQQLYTETTLTAYLPWAHDKKRETLLLAARLWII